MSVHLPLLFCSMDIVLNRFVVTFYYTHKSMSLSTLNWESSICNVSWSTQQSMTGHHSENKRFQRAYGPYWSHHSCSSLRNHSRRWSEMTEDLKVGAASSKQAASSGHRKAAYINSQCLQEYAQNLVRPCKTRSQREDWSWAHNLIPSQWDIRYC